MFLVADQMKNRILATHLGSRIKLVIHTGYAVRIRFKVYLLLLVRNTNPERHKKQP